MVQVVEILENKMNKVLTFMDLIIRVGRGQIMQDLVAMLRNVRFVWILF